MSTPHRIDILAVHDITQQRQKLNIRQQTSMDSHKDKCSRVEVTYNDIDGSAPTELQNGHDGQGQCSQCNDHKAAEW